MSVSAVDIDEARKREKLAKLSFLKAQKELTLATMHLFTLESNADEQVIKDANNTRKKRARQEITGFEVSTPPAPIKKRKEEWVCHGNVLLGDSNPGCPGGTEKHRVRDTDTRFEKKTYTTCRACKNEMKAIKRKAKNKDKEVF